MRIRKSEQHNDKVDPYRWVYTYLNKILHPALKNIHCFWVHIEHVQKLTTNQVIVQRHLYKVLKTDITETRISKHIAIRLEVREEGFKNIFGNGVP